MQDKITKKWQKLNYEILHTRIEQMVCICTYIYFIPKKNFVVDEKGLRGIQPFDILNIIVFFSFM